MHMHMHMPPRPHAPVCRHLYVVVEGDLDEVPVSEILPPDLLLLVLLAPLVTVLVRRIDAHARRDERRAPQRVEDRLRA